MEIVVSEMFTLCADDLVVGLVLLFTFPTTLEFMTAMVEGESSVEFLSSMVLLWLSSIFPTTPDFKTMVVLGRGESLCTDVIDVDNGDADNDDDVAKCDDVESATADEKPGAEH